MDSNSPKSLILVLNFGGQYCHLIARRVRDLGVRSEIVPNNAPASAIAAMKPSGIILSGGPSSVYEHGAPTVDSGIFGLGVPILGICYGHQLLALKTGGRVEKGKTKEYGANQITLSKEAKNSLLLSGLSPTENVWLSHGDWVSGVGGGFAITAKSADGITAAVENPGKRFYGVQFHPEVVHTEHGKEMLENFVFKICKCKKNWQPEMLEKQLETQVAALVGDKQVLMAVSGGVDSTVAATIIHRAIGNRLHCVFIDHGLLRKNEAAEVCEFFEKKLKFKNFHFVDASNAFLSKLDGVGDPEEKRRIIGHTFIEVFEQKARELKEKHGEIAFLGQGTIYPDRIESAQPSAQAAKIKSHHNLTLPEKMSLRLIEPLRELYKDEVRQLGTKMGLPKELLWRHPFPGPGLAIRVVGEFSREKLEICREADAIFIEELRKNKLYDKTWQAFAAVLPVKTVGVMGDSRTYAFAIALRAVTSIDGMTADWAKLPLGFAEKVSNRIVNEVKGANRVFYDVTQKPPGTIEYE
ncbi:MAG: glutamine-hydrolyzing GMP synthase [Candidatus Micrarchaeia archaeon]|jgi:GMP synthase (glutamine-hydrolysing)